MGIFFQIMGCIPFKIVIVRNYCFSLYRALSIKTCVNYCHSGLKKANTDSNFPFTFLLIFKSCLLYAFFMTYMLRSFFSPLVSCLPKELHVHLQRSDKCIGLFAYLLLISFPSSTSFHTLH